VADDYSIHYQAKNIDISAVQGDKLAEEIKSALASLGDKEKEFKRNVTGNLSDFAEKNSVFRNTVEEICAYIESDKNREKYFTLYERLPEDINRYKQTVAKLTIDLGEIDNSKNQLVNACTNMAKGIYENLKMLTRKSAVNIGGNLRNMLKISLPEVEDTALAKYSIERHIEKCVDEYINLIDRDSAVSVIDDFVKKSMDLRKLLNCYINTENIPLSVYKIDISSHHSRYRGWEETIVGNSGGEKFVVFFALLLSMMNYSRGVIETMQKSSGVLIMDNPFGPISSGHLLRPMFDIAKHFNIQLICFSGLDTADITACFTNVCRLKIKQLPFGGKEILGIETEQTEQNEELEHAFFRTEQLSLF
jgi:uncharacterized membrane protein